VLLKAGPPKAPAVIAGGPVRAGGGDGRHSDILPSPWARPNPHNVVKATFAARLSLRSEADVMASRG